MQDFLYKYYSLREISEMFKVPQSTLRGRIVRTKTLGRVMWESTVVKWVTHWRITPEFLEKIIGVRPVDAPKTDVPKTDAPSGDNVSIDIRVTVTREHVKRFIDWLRSFREAGK